MRRSEIIEGVRRVKEAIELSGVSKVISSILQREGRPSDVEAVVKLMDSFRKFSHFARDFGPTEQRIMEIFGLAALDSPTYWAHAAVEPSVVHELYLKLNPVERYLDQFIALLETEVQAQLKRSAGNKNSLGATQILSAIVIETDQQFSTPERLISVLYSINGLYEAVVTVEDLPSSSLAVVACDSGSDKAFDFLGLAKAIVGVKDIIISVWDRVVFYRERQLAVRIELISESLPVIERLASLRDSQAIGPEQSELLKRKIIDNVSRFLEAGVIIPEITEVASFDPRQLLAPETKLLTAGPPESDIPPRGESNPNPTEPEGLSNEEEEVLARLLSKARKTRP